MRFSLIVATIHRIETLYRLFDSVRAQSYPNFEVIVVDQNSDQRVDKVLEKYAGVLPYKHLRAHRTGRCAASNEALPLAAGDFVTFPDDDSYYPPSLFESVARFFEEHSRWDVLSMRQAQEDETSWGGWARTAGAITRHNLWNRHIAFSMFFRRKAVEGLFFDESLGPGANTPWLAGEETDFLLRVLQAGSKAYYDPSLLVFHPDPAKGPFSAEIFGKTRRYGMAMGHVLKMHRYPLAEVVYRLVRPLAGAVLSLLRGRMDKSRYYWEALRGRAGGWLTTPASLLAASGSKPSTGPLRDQKVRS